MFAKWKSTMDPTKECNENQQKCLIGICYLINPGNEWQNQQKNTTVTKNTQIISNELMNWPSIVLNFDKNSLNIRRMMHKFKYFIGNALPCW